jgi:hypothetical protein
VVKSADISALMWITSIHQFLEKVMGVGFYLKK